MKTTCLDGLWQHGRNFLGVRYPIMCGAMTWISDATLVKAVGDQGGFGCLAAGNMPGEALAAEIDKTLAATQAPFAVNLVTIAPNFPAHKEAVLKSKAATVIFAGNFPKKNDVAQMKAAGKKVLSFASTDSIAEQMVRFGVDGLILEGSEAGGHIGHVSLMILLQQVLFKNPGVPVFVAGGIATGRMIAHMLLMGAAGVQMGTRFVATDECDADDRFKQSYVEATEKDVVIIKSPVGMPGRAIHNEFLDLAAEGSKTPARCPYRCIHTCDYTKAPYCITLALANAKKGRLRHGFAFAGQNAWRVDRIMSVAELFRELIEGYEAAEAASPA